MAHVISNPSISAARKGIFSRFIAWLAETSEARARPMRRDIIKLQGMSDHQLADIGIRRDEIEIRVISGRSFM